MKCINLKVKKNIRLPILEIIKKRYLIFYLEFFFHIKNVCINFLLIRITLSTEHNILMMQIS